MKQAFSVRDNVSSKSIITSFITQKLYQKSSSRYKAISELISARIKKGISQKELAQKIGTKQSAIARFEAGNINPSLGFLEKMAEVMGYKVNISLSK